MDQRSDGSSPATVTRLLSEMREGNEEAFGLLLPHVYEELRRVAARQRRRWVGDETLDTTALVHEAYLRLASQAGPWENRAHFLAVAGRAMRQILMDYAKRRSAARRGGGQQPVPLDRIEGSLAAGADPAEVGGEALLALGRSLDRLESVDVRQSRIVECRFFGRMTIGETAEALGISPASVKRGWAVARAWLYRDLKRTLGEGPSPP